MKNLIYLTIFTILLFSTITSTAYAVSDEAQLFMDVCRAIDCPKPPFDDDKEILRYAVLEVLDEIEAGSVDEWYLTFCLKTLGYTNYPEDVYRILSYREKMPKIVLLSLRGFPHPDAIKYLLENIDNKEVTMRKVAVEGLAEIDFKKLDEPSKWHNKVLTKLRLTNNKEEVSWMFEVLDKAITRVEKSGKDIN